MDETNDLLRAVMGRLEEMNAELKSLRGEVTELRDEVRTFRHDTNERLEKLEERLNFLALKWMDQDQEIQKIKRRQT